MSGEHDITEVAPSPTIAESTDANLIPASEVKPEDVGMLSLRYVDRVPVLVVSGGRFMPARLTAVDTNGRPIAAMAESTDANLIPASEVKPEDVGMLSLRYVNRVPVLVVNGGRFMPARLTAVDATGRPIAAFTAGQHLTASTRMNAVARMAPVEMLSMLEDVIHELDVEPELIQIEATVMDVQNGLLKELGFDWSLR
ncbi:hypothetical protein [Streptomyces sp. NPDC001903]|uniref:hypothetical protein n=1 Tax=Streptomyces sp. NPDC001903 TaxID=3364622 RepID=UPI0036A1B84E